VIGRFVRTDRNEPASGFFAAAGFVDRGAGVWEAAPGTAPEVSDWIGVSER